MNAASKRILPYDLSAAVRALGRSDPQLRALMRKVGPCTLPALLQADDSLSAFEALARSVVHQQLAGAAAAAIFGRVKALFRGGKLTPRALLRLSDASLRGAGLSGSKLVALRDLAAKALDGTIPESDAFHGLSDEAIIERLTTVRGVGRWTVEMFLMFRLGRTDVLPVADYGVRKGFAHLFGNDELPTPKELAQYGERWRPHRTVASWYLWRAADLAKLKSPPGAKL